MANRELTGWLLVLLFLVVGRCLVPTHIDVSSTSLFKDVAHLLLGGMFAASWYRLRSPYCPCHEDWDVHRFDRRRFWIIQGLFWSVSLFELAMSLAT